MKRACELQSCHNLLSFSCFRNSAVFDFPNNWHWLWLSSRISARKSQALHMEPKRDERQNNSIESVYMSSDDADSMRVTRLEVRERRRSSSVDSIHKSSDYVPLSENAQGETSDDTCSIQVSSLPPNISEELIADFFENSKRSGGGDVEYVAYDETNKTAIITFQNPTVVENVLKKHKTKYAITNQTIPPKKDESEWLVMAVKVTNLPPKIRKLQVELFFENPKKSGSGNEDLEKVDYDEAANCAIVWFKESEVVTKVLEKHKTSPFTLNKQKVEVEEYRPGLDEDKSSFEKGENVVEAIKISNIPPETTEKELVLYFENRKRSGGDDVENVNYDRSTHTAVIWFKEEDAVKRVLEKTHKLNGLNLTIKRYQSPKVIANRTLVEALNPEISKGGIKNYLEGKSGDNVTFKQEEGTAMVTFETSIQQRRIQYLHTSAMMASKTRDHIVVVAIDFGTTYSGYAFSFRSDFLKDKTDHLNKIYTDKWNSGNLLSEKTPTTLLLDKEKKFVSFGYDAEIDYSRMSEEERKEHYYFRRFKMMLYDKDGKLKLTRDTVLKDLRDKEMPAIDVFARSIEYLKDEFVKKFEERNLQVSVIKPLNKNVTWVLTVPAIWDEPAKQFMEEAAELAGISKESLLICLEPEAAAVYCKWIQIERDNDALNLMKPGRRFLVLDAGGGTIDMAMQEVREDGKIQEINRAQGGDWGKIYVDEEFKQMLEYILSKPIIEAFRMKYTGDYIALFRSFEQKIWQTQTGKRVRVDIPPTLLEIAEDFNKCIEDHGLKDEVELKKDKLQIKVGKFEEFFNKVLDKIAVKVEEMLVSDTAEGTKVIIMVGGFSECEFLQRRIRNSFPSCTVVIPQECGLAVLKGAVLYGHDPGIIAARVAKYTYGLGINTRFIKDKHPESKKKLISGIEYCTDKFDIHVNKGTLVHCNEETEKNYFPLYENQTSVNFGVFASNAVEPQYTDDEGCKEIGSLTVPMPDTKGGTGRRVKANFKFGATKITVEGLDETSKKSVDVKIDFLENKP